MKNKGIMLVNLVRIITIIIILILVGVTLKLALEDNNMISGIEESEGQLSDLESDVLQHPKKKRRNLE